MASKTPPGTRVPHHLRQRIQLLRRRIGKSAADVLLVTNPVDIRYLTGFVGDDSWAVVPSGGTGVTVISDSRFEQQITREAPHVRAVIRKGGLVDELANWLKGRKAEKVGVQAEHVSVQLHGKLRDKLGKSAVVPIDDKLIDQRAVKDDDEVHAIRQALKIQQRAYKDLLEHIHPGMTEYQAAAFLEYRMRCLGADGTSFPSIVAADTNAALPHAIPGPSKIRKNGILLIDWGARWHGYCADLTRVVALGRMPTKMAEVYRVVLDAQLAAIDAIAPGVALREVDAVARRIITKAGYGDRFGHGLGHGIGLDIHEQPNLSPRAPENGVLEPGHVVTVEPGIYLPGVGGVRIEDDVLVTEKGRTVLSNLPKSLESTII